MDETNKNAYIPQRELDDLYMSAFCLARGAELVNTIQHGTHSTWVFKAMNIDDLVTAYHNNGAVGVQDFIARLRSLRSMVRSGRP